MYAKPSVQRSPEATVEDEWEQQRRQQDRRNFRSHVVDYVGTNIFLIGLWGLSGGYFWPAWVLAAWGAGVIVHAWQTFLRQPIAESDNGAPDAVPSVFDTSKQ
jgi:hypothetical protein